MFLLRKYHMKEWGEARMSKRALYLSLSIYIYVYIYIYIIFARNPILYAPTIYALQMAKPRAYLSCRKFCSVNLTVESRAQARASPHRTRRAAVDELVFVENPEIPNNTTATVYSLHVVVLACSYQLILIFILTLAALSQTFYIYTFT